MITWDGEKAARALGRTARAALAAAEEGCPVRTGRLKSSLSGTVGEDRAVVSANTDYAVYVELGTGKTPPNPFLQNALFAAAEAAGEIYREEILKK